MCEIAGNSVRQSSFAPRGDRRGAGFGSTIHDNMYIIYVLHEAILYRITHDYIDFNMMRLYESHTFWYFRTVQYSIGLTFHQGFGKAKSIYTKP